VGNEFFRDDMYCLGFGAGVGVSRNPV
jgi:hypothetical protein